jgi:hypothetical protein
MTEWDKLYMNARRHPRTMTEAFGPYTDDTLHPMPDQRKTPAHEVALYIVAVLAVAAILIFQP